MRGFAAQTQNTGYHSKRQYKSSFRRLLFCRFRVSKWSEENDYRCYLSERPADSQYGYRRCSPRLHQAFLVKHARKDWRRWFHGFLQNSVWEDSRGCILGVLGVLWDRKYIIHVCQPAGLLIWVSVATQQLWKTLVQVRYCEYSEPSQSNSNYCDSPHHLLCRSGSRFNDHGYPWITAAWIRCSWLGRSELACSHLWNCYRPKSSRIITNQECLGVWSSAEDAEDTEVVTEAQEWFDQFGLVLRSFKLTSWPMKWRA